MHITILTDSLHKIAGTGNGNVEQSLLLGLAAVVPQELGARCRNIDINLREQPSKLAASVKREIESNSTDRIVALRCNQRWIKHFERNTAKGEDKRILRNGGLYLVTGGLGNAGFVLSKYLLSKYNARLVLAGRRNVEECTGDAGRRLEYLKTLSNDLMYAQVDISDPLALKQLVESIESASGHIDGVIHAAGVLEKSRFEWIKDISVPQTTNIWAPKVNGIQSIYEAFKEKQTDFVWIMSSMSALLGGLGYAAYAAANSYMDHFLFSLEEGCTRWRSVDLTGLTFQEDGAGDDTAVTPEELTALFEFTLGREGNAVMAVHKGDLHTDLERYYAATFQQNGVEEKPIGPAIEKRRRPELAVKYTAPATETEIVLTGILEEFFSFDRVGVDDLFFDLGGDSLRAMVLLKRIKTRFEVNLSLQEFLFNSSVREIARKIDEMQWLQNRTGKEHEITI